MTDPDPGHPPSEEALLARYPHASALGKLLPAAQAHRHAVAHDLRRFTEHMVTDDAELAAELKQVAETGLARRIGQLRSDRSCLAVAVRHPVIDRLVGGLALSGPPTRGAQPNGELISVVREHAERLGPLPASEVLPVSPGPCCSDCVTGTASWSGVRAAR
ncbi:IclR family transcriptional regulator C-terminal domain-containing protein [Streptomyces sp. NPDC019531]|uniref:IclR family transcriptional regulator domain-containing protein n=1 Tax=Streptomyces sp. NPDC019531 TaxID=3365062 RepID=UPI00384BF22E